MSKIISMPSNNAYRESWNRIFGNGASDRTETEAQEKESKETSGCTQCGCGKKVKKENA